MIRVDISINGEKVLRYWVRDMATAKTTAEEYRSMMKAEQAEIITEYTEEKNR